MLRSCWHGIHCIGQFECSHAGVSVGNLLDHLGQVQLGWLVPTLPVPQHFVLKTQDLRTQLGNLRHQQFLLIGLLLVLRLEVLSMLLLLLARFAGSQAVAFEEPFALCAFRSSSVTESQGVGLGGNRVWVSATLYTDVAAATHIGAIGRVLVERGLFAEASMMATVRERRRSRSELVLRRRQIHALGGSPVIECRRHGLAIADVSVLQVSFQVGIAKAQVRLAIPEWYGRRHEPGIPDLFILGERQAVKFTQEVGREVGITTVANGKTRTSKP